MTTSIIRYVVDFRSWLLSLDCFSLVVFLVEREVGILVLVLIGFIDGVPVWMILKGWEDCFKLGAQVGALDGFLVGLYVGDLDGFLEYDGIIVGSLKDGSWVWEIVGVKDIVGIMENVGFSVGWNENVGPIEIVGFTETDGVKVGSIEKVGLIENEGFKVGGVELGL